MTSSQYSIRTTLVFGLLLCVPASPLPTSPSQSAEETGSDTTSPRIPEVQGSLSQEGKSKSQTGYNNPYEEIAYMSKPPSFNIFDQYGNPVSSGHSSSSGNQKQLLYSSLYPGYQTYPSVLYRTKSSLTLLSTNNLAQQNQRLRQMNQHMLRQNGLGRSRYMYPMQNMYANQFPFSYTPMPNVIPLPVNSVQSYYPPYPNVYPYSDTMYPYPNQNSFIRQNEQSQTPTSQNSQQQRPQQNPNNSPSQDQEHHNSNENQNSVLNQPGNQNVPQQPNVNHNEGKNQTGNGNQNQNVYPSSGMQNGGGQNIYPGGTYPNQNFNPFLNAIPIQYTGPDNSAPVIYQYPFPYGYQTPNQNVQYRPIST